MTSTPPAVAAALAAKALARLYRIDAEVPKPNVQTERSHQGPSDTNVHAFLPDRFVKEERVARIEPLPPPF